MTAALAVGLVVLAAMASPLLWLYPAWRGYCRSLDAAEAEWVRLVGVIESAHQDFDPLAAMPLYDRITHDQMAPFFSRWQEAVDAEVAES